MHPLQNLAQTKTAQDSGTGSGSAAEVFLGPLRRMVDIHVDTSGGATLTVEVSKDGSNWRTFDSITYSGASQEVEQYDIAFEHVRAYLGSSRNLVEISAKGVN